MCIRLCICIIAGGDSRRPGESGDAREQIITMIKHVAIFAFPVDIDLISLLAHSNIISRADWGGIAKGGVAKIQKLSPKTPHQHVFSGRTLLNYELLLSPHSLRPPFVPSDICPE